MTLSGGREGGEIHTVDLYRKVRDSERVRGEELVDLFEQFARLQHVVVEIAVAAATR